MSNVAEPFYIVFSSNRSNIYETSKSTSYQTKPTIASSSIVSNCSSTYETPTTLITTTNKATGTSFRTVMSGSSVLTSPTNVSSTVSGQSFSQKATSFEQGGTITSTFARKSSGKSSVYPSTNVISTVSPGASPTPLTSTSASSVKIASTSLSQLSSVAFTTTSGIVSNCSSTYETPTTLITTIYKTTGSPFSTVMPGSSVLISQIIAKSTTNVSSTVSRPKAVNPSTAVSSVVSSVAFSTPRSEQIVILDVSLTFKNKDFMEELYDKNSSPFLEMKKEVENKIEIAYKGIDNFVYAFITGFRPGSVICDGRLYFKNDSKSDILSSEKTLAKYGSSGGGFTVSKFDINAGDDDNNDGDDEIILGLDWWQIGVIIAGIVVFILIITVIVLCVSINSTGHLTNELHSNNYELYYAACMSDIFYVGNTSILVTKMSRKPYESMNINFTKFVFFSKTCCILNSLAHTVEQICPTKITKNLFRLLHGWTDVESREGGREGDVSKKL